MMKARMEAKMGYYYDWINAKWIERERGLRPTIGPSVRRRRRRRTLIGELLTEIAEGHDSDATLYATLLARALVTTDEELMKEYGEHIAHVSAGEEAA
jgi:hypothetical protein